MSRPLSPTPKPSRSRAGARRPAGFSLIELVIAIGLSAVVMMALGSAMVLASRALPDSDSPALLARQTAPVLEQLSHDLQHALHVTERTSHAITFTVSDRTGDGSPQRLRYAWSGTPGDPLTWQLDNHAPVPLLPAVDHFELHYHSLAQTEHYPGPLVPGPETVIASYPATGNSSEFSISSSQWLGQHILPTLSPEAVAWHPTAVAYRARKPLLNLLADRYDINLHATNLVDHPTSSILASGSHRAGLLNLARQWYTIGFTNTQTLPRGQAVQLILRYASGGLGTLMYVEFDANAPFPGGRTHSTNAGYTWTGPDTTRAIPHFLHGFEYFPSPDQTLTRHHLHRIHLTLQPAATSSAATSPTYTTAIHLPNRPPLLTAHWELDFRHDPTALDTNADGQLDWQLLSGSSFNTTDLLDTGVWHARQALRTWPDHNFNEPTVVHLRLRHANPTPGGAIALLHADRQGSTVGPVGVLVQRLGNNTQTVHLFTFNDNHDHDPLISLPGYHTGFLDVRLLINPHQQAVNLRVEGVNHGTFSYNRVSANGTNRALNLSGWHTDAAEFQHARLTVGGSP